MADLKTDNPRSKAMPNDQKNEATLRPGFKHTKLGWIPEEWEVHMLKKLVETKRKIRYGIVQAGPNTPGGIPCLRVVDLSEDTIKLDMLYRTTEAISKKYAQCILQPGDIVFALRGEIGKMILVDDRISGINITRGVARICPKNGVDSNFLFYQLQSTAVRRLINVQVNGTSLKEVPIGGLNKIEVPLPQSVSEQRRIAKVLGTWDRAIATAQELLTAQQERKRGLMQELLSGRKRFPGFGGKWKEVRLGQVVTKAKGSVVTSNADSNGIPVIDAGSFEGMVTLYSTDQVALRCNETDVLLLWDGSKAGRAMTGKKGIVGSTFVLLKPKAELHPVFLTAILTLDEQRIMAVREGSGIPHVPKDFLRWYHFLLPPLNEQEAIIRTIHGMEQIEDSFKEKIAHLTTQKRGLMQVLLTGEVRVKH